MGTRQQAQLIASTQGPFLNPAYKIPERTSDQWRAQSSADVQACTFKDPERRNSACISLNSSSPDILGQKLSVDGWRQWQGRTSGRALCAQERGPSILAAVDRVCAVQAAWQQRHVLVRPAQRQATENFVRAYARGTCRPFRYSAPALWQKPDIRASTTHCLRQAACQRGRLPCCSNGNGLRLG